MKGSLEETPQRGGRVLAYGICVVSAMVTCYLVSTLFHVASLCDIVKYLLVLICIANGIFVESVVRRRRKLAQLFWLSFVLLSVAISIFLHNVKSRSNNLVTDVAGLHGNVTVFVEENTGIVHIDSDSPDEYDSFFIQGLVMAQQRTFQMELQRRLAAGQVSQLVGRNGLKQDLLFRTLELHTAAQRSFDGLKKEPTGKYKDAIRSLERFADGVNAYFRNEKMFVPPIEMYILSLVTTGSSPPSVLDSWTPVDSLLWNAMMSYDLSMNMERELHRFKLLTQQGLSRERIDVLFPAFDLEAFPTIVQPEDVCDEDKRHIIEDRSCVNSDSVNDWLDSQRAIKTIAVDKPALMSSDPFHLLRGNNYLGMLGASNNWVVSGDKTESGKPILANDPHLTLTAPSVWMLFSITNRRFNESFMGASFVGLPGIVLGRNKHIAWGVTNTGADVQDLFRLQMVGENSYLHNNTTVNLTLREEEIFIAGKSEPYRITIREAPHYGPIITDNDDVVRGLLKLSDDEPFVSMSDTPLALRWTDLSEKHVDTSYFSFFKLNKAENYEGFREALRFYVVPGQNFIFADNEGIGYQMTGKIPRRKNGHTGLYPVVGNGTFDWHDEFIPFDELPSVRNPKQGFVATANNNVAPPCFGVTPSCEWDALDGYRAKRITQVIQANSKITVESMTDLQQDVRSLFAEDMYHTLIKPLCDDGENVLSSKAKQLCDTLSSWGFETPTGSMEASLFHMFVTELYKVAHNDTKEKYWTEMYFVRNAFNGNVSCTSELDSEACRRFAVEAFELVAGLEDVKPYGTMEFKPVQFESPVFKGTPFECLFSRQVEKGGDHSCVNVGNFELPSFLQTSGPSFRQVTTFEDQDRSGSVIINGLGQNGSPLSQNYDSMLKPWAMGGYLKFGDNPKANGPVTEFSFVEAVGYEEE